MSKRQIVFLVCLIWFLIWIPVGGYWGWNPVRWVEGHGFFVEDITLMEAEAAFPIHLAPFQPSAISQHARQITDEETEPTPRFEAYDWALRELRYRYGIVFFLFLISGFYMRWFLDRIVRGRTTWED